MRGSFDARRCFAMLIEKLQRRAPGRRQETTRSRSQGFTARNGPREERDQRAKRWKRQGDGERTFRQDPRCRTDRRHGQRSTRSQAKPPPFAETGTDARVCPTSRQVRLRSSCRGPVNRVRTSVRGGGEPRRSAISCLLRSEGGAAEDKKIAHSGQSCELRRLK